MLLASWYDRNSLVLQDQAQLQTDSDLWLLAEGRSSTMITSRMVENRRRQKASSTHKSLHPCGKDTNKNTEMDVQVAGKVSLFISVYARNPQRWQDQGTSTECNNRKQTDRLAVHQLEDFGGPDDEYDGSCPHKVNNGVTLMSVRGNPSCNSWYSPTTEKMRVLVKCWYNESFTMFLRSFRRRVVWDRLMKM